jgi:ubiquinone/menaquinone biosynthesis C-methylase UbiE
MPPLARLYLWATHRLYNEFAWAYDLVAWVVSGGRWDRWRRLALDYVVGEPVLEVGFGTGELLLALAAQGWQVAGLDLSPAMQRVTAQKMRRRGLWALRVRGAAQHLPFPDASLATVVSTFPAEYIIDPAALRELHRVLRPDGRLVIVGLVVLMESMWWSRFSRLVFGDIPESPLTRYQRRAAEIGFAVTVDMRDDPPFRVPVVVAEKRS